MRKIIKTIAAAAVAMTSFSAVPAAAGNKNLERFVIGAGTILLLNELHKHGKAEVHHKKYGQKNYGHKKHGKKNYGKHRRAALPDYCLTKIRKNHQWIRVYGQRCLWNNYRHARFLPRHCKVQATVWRHGRKIHRVGYSPRCLRRAGFRA